MNDEVLKRIDMITIAYMALVTALSGLPVPIAVAEFGPDCDPEILMESLCRARELLEDEPVPAAVQRGLRDMTLDWVTAHELMAAVAHLGDRPWRLQGIDAALGRFTGTALMLGSGALDSPEE